MSFRFPDSFRWGVATAAHQVEGNNQNSDYWLYEHIPNTEFVEPSGLACDHYNRYAEDIALIASLGFNTYRLSVEWARIEPQEGEFSAKELEHYRHVLEICHEHAIKPIVTFHHFTSPQWLIASGGWESPRTPDRFARYCDRTSAALGDLIDMACTLNEANTGRLVETTQMFGPLAERRRMPWVAEVCKALNIKPAEFTAWNFAASEQAVEVILEAHHKAREAIKSNYSRVPVGLTLSMQNIQAAEGGEEAAKRVRDEVEDQFLRELKHDDFVGVQTYRHWHVGPEGILPPDPDEELTDMGYAFSPEALEPTIRHAIEVTGIPVVVTESGVGTEDDTRRIVYLERAIKGVVNCLQDGLDVRGFLAWSALDNFEWEFGYRPKFGLIAVDSGTLERIPKPSARWLGDIAKQNAMDQT